MQLPKGSLIPEGRYDALKGEVPLLNVILDEHDFKKLLREQMSSGNVKLGNLEEKMNESLKFLGSPNARGVVQFKYEHADEKGENSVFTLKYKTVLVKPAEILPAEQIISALISMAGAYKEKVALCAIIYKHVAKASIPLVAPKFDQLQIAAEIDRHIKYFSEVNKFVEKTKAH